MLLLKRHLVELVRQGKKRQTIRLWTKAMLKPGQISYTPGLGRMLITKVDELQSLEALTEADARADGFANLDGLLAEIHKIYGREIPKNRLILRIAFQWPVEEGAGETRGQGGNVTNRAPPVETKAEKALKTAPVKPSRPMRPKKPRKKSEMTAAHKQTLRSFILSKAPRG